jgi:small GTP-binding protein
MIGSARSDVYRLITVGDSFVGKTSILTRLIDGNFHADESPTNVSAYLEHRIPVDGKQVTVQIWDTAGQERFRGLSGLYFRDADAALFVFELTNASSLESIEWWFEAFSQSEKESLIYLVGNKKDIGSETLLDPAQEWGTEHGAQLFLTSALTGEGINDLFRQIGKDLLSRSLPPKAIRWESSDGETLARSCC